MMRVRCPECGVEVDVVPLYGEEIVSVYCLQHHGGADGHTRPVRMIPTRAPQGVIEREPVAASPAPRESARLRQPRGDRRRPERNRTS